MTIASLNNSSTATPSRTQLSERIGKPAEGTSATLSGMAEGVVAGVSATVSFTGQALHALESAGEFVVDGVEDMAVGAWHGIEHAAEAAHEAGSAVVDAVEAGAHEIATAAKATGKELAHYAQVGAQVVGEGVSELASGTVMAASAVGKTVMALI